MFTYSAICDVPEETLRYVTALLRAHRREIGTRAGRRAVRACNEKVRLAALPT